MNKKGILFAVFAAILWSSGGVFIKLVDAPAIFIAAARSFIAFLFFSPGIRIKEIKVTANFLALLFLYSYTLISFVLANKLTTAANAIILQYTAPVWLFLFYMIFKKQYDKKKILPMMIILFGIFLFLLEPSDGTNIIGNIIALSSGLSFGMVAYFSAKSYGMGTTSLISLCNLCTCVLAFPFIKNPAGIIASLTLSDIAGIMILGILQIGLGYVFYLKSLKIINPLDVSVICLIEPILNPVWVLLFVYEFPSIYALIASLLILSGIFANILKERKALT